MDDTNSDLWSRWKEEVADSKENLREQRSEFFIGNEEESVESRGVSECNSSSINISVGYSKRRRGRPPKNLSAPSNSRMASKKVDPDYVEPDSSTDSGEERNESEEEFQDDDPEFDPDRHNRKTRKLIKSCSAKTLSKEGMSKIIAMKKTSSRGRGRGSRCLPSYKRLSEFYRIQCEMPSKTELERLFEEELSQYLPLLPSPTIGVPPNEYRQYVCKIDQLEAIKSASGGFKLFANSVTDKAMLSLFQLVSDRYSVSSKAGDVVQLAQVLRHVWNLFPIERRKEWEMAARRLIISHENDESTDIGCSDDVLKLKTHITMPKCEIPFEECRRLTKHSKDVECGEIPVINCICCESAVPWTNFIDVQSHMLAAHYTAIFYGCHYCGMLFQSVDELLIHSSCVSWSKLILERVLIRQDEGVLDNAGIEMNIAHLYLICTDCGLWLPIKMDYCGERFTKAWSFFVTVMNNHSCKELVPVIVYMVENFDIPAKDARISFQFLPSFVKSFPLDCSECGIPEFHTPDEVESHFKLKHSDSKRLCGKCGELFGTEPYLKAHLMTHLSDSLLLGNYFRTSCRFFPPPHIEGPPVFGSEKLKAVGGVKISSFHGQYIDYIDSCKSVLVEKLKNAIDNRFSNLHQSEDDEGYSEEQSRPDFGYEFADYKHLEDSSEQKETKRAVISFFQTMNMSISRFIDWRTKFVDCVGIRAKLGIKPGSNIHEIHGKTITLSSLEFANLTAKRFIKTISLPISACVELLSGNLLHKRFAYCINCHSVLSSGAIETHEKGECGPEMIVALFTPGMPTNSTLACALCTAQLCSISALRSHMSLEHSLYVDHKMSTNTPSYVIDPCLSLIEIATNPPDIRSGVARETDNLLGLVLGRLKANTEHEMRIKLAQRGISAGRGRGSRTVISKSPSVFPTPRANIASSLRETGIPSYTKPFYLRKLANQHVRPFNYGKYRGEDRLKCKYCVYFATVISKMQEHLRLYHTLICRGCGSAFANEQYLLQHKEDLCSNEFNRVSVGHISAKCGVCRSRMQLHLAYNHLFQQHLDSVYYGSNSGKIYPIHLDLQVTGPTDTMQQLVSLPPVFVGSAIAHSKQRNFAIYESPSQVKYVCYLCGIEAGSKSHLDRHLSMHTEKWSTCPLCDRVVRITSHEEMQKHLSIVHLVKKDGFWMCRFCDKLMNRGYYAHLLYGCEQTRICVFCNIMFNSSGELVKHWTKCHAEIFHKFECSECFLQFYLVSDFRDHHCRLQFMPHRCNCGFEQVFQSRNAFNLHFGVHVDETGSTCKLCGIQFSSRTALQTHRQFHAIVLADPADRKMRVLNPGLIVPEWINEKENEGKSEESLCGGWEFKMVEKDVLETINSLVTIVCEIMKERETTSIPSSPEEFGLNIEGLDYLGDNISVLEEQAIHIGHNRTRGDSLNSVALEAQVRVEVTDNLEDQHGGDQPGYIADDNNDDEIEFIGEQYSSRINQQIRVDPVVKNISGDGDDELQVIAEVENPMGALPQAILTASRTKKYKCSRCSEMYFTMGALRNHQETAHTADAGGICDKVYGVPTESFFFICRNCCVAFEDMYQFKEHRDAHGVNGSLSCAQCSSISYNLALYQQHLEAHATTDKLFYGCGICSHMFKTDLKLMYHLRTVHHRELFFFCKICGLGGINGRAIYLHVSQKSERCRMIAIERKWTTEQSIGVGPANILHFQPKDIIMHENNLTAMRISVMIPSECTHRSFLAPTDTVIACKECFCTMTISSYSACETCKNGGKLLELAMTLDPCIDFPFKEVYDMQPAPISDSLTRISQPIASQISQYKTSHLPVRMHHIRREINYLNPTGSPYIVSSPTTLPTTQQNHSVVLTMHRNFTSTLSRVISSSKKDSLTALQKTNGSTIKRRASTMCDVITLSDEDQPGPSSGKRHIKEDSVQKTSITRPFIRNPEFPIRFKNGTYGKCRVCSVHIDSLQMSALHELHTNGKKWFCLDCANAQMNEVDAVKHYYATHVKTAEQKAAKGGECFRPLYYSLQCPYPTCRKPIVSISALKIHFVQCHRDESKHLSKCCGTRFCTASARDKHDNLHIHFESINGAEGSCCPLCGTLNLWSLQSSGSGYNMNHVAIHGLRKYHMCRDCFVCFKSDVDCTRMKRHFEAVHCDMVLGSRAMQCKLCTNIYTTTEMANHIIEKHLVTGYKSRDPRNPGQLIVKAGAATREFLGFEKAYYEGDESDMD